MLVVFPVPLPVEQFNDDITIEWPLQLVIIFPLHETSRDRHMSTLATAKTIGIHIKAHLVALWLCVEWRAVVFIAKALAFGELCHRELAQ